MDSVKIVDAHQHFWDLEHNYYPWLCDQPPIPFRYGDYSAIRKSYLPQDYFRDTAGHQVVKTVHAVAKQPNIAVKISGLGYLGQPWSIAENGRMVLNTIEIFGVDRCMFASNFPVDKIVADFDTIVTTFKIVMGDFPATDREYLFHNNAVRIYRL